MRLLRTWTPFFISVCATPFALLTGFLSAGMGEGNYFVAKLLFPYTMLSTVFLDSIITPFLLVAVAQFPIYGAIVSLAGEKKLTLSILAIIHIAIAVLCLVFIGENFS